MPEARNKIQHQYLKFMEIPFDIGVDTEYLLKK